MNTLSSTKYIPILATLSMVLIDMGTDFLIPNIPSLVTLFHAKEEYAQLAVSLNLFGIAVSGLFYGALSDCFGRRRVLLLGLSLFLFGSLFCYFSTSLERLIIARLIQGLGGGVGIVVGFASINDLLSGEDYSRMMSVVMMIVSISHVVAPLVGGYMGAYFGWNSVYLLVSGLCVISLFFIWKHFSETVPAEKLDRFRLKKLINHYLEAFRSRVFLAYAFMKALALAMIWVELANFPLLFINGFGIKAQHYSYYYGSRVFLYIFGVYLNNIWVKRVGIDRMLKIGLAYKSFGMLAFLLAAVYNIKSPILGMLVIYPGAMAMAFIYGNVVTKAMDALKAQKGAGSALMTTIELVFASLAVPVVAFFYDGTFYPIAGAGLAWIALTYGVYGFARKFEKDLPAALDKAELVHLEQQVS